MYYVHYSAALATTAVTINSIVNRQYKLKR